MRRAWVIVSALAALGGCSRSAERAAEGRRREPSAERERADVATMLDEIEARLLVGRARVRFWEEMRERHESVSAVACTTLERHAEGIALFQSRVRQQREASRHRVAARVARPAAEVTQ